MRDRVLDEGDDIGIGDLAGGEVGENKGAGDVQRLLQGVAWSMRPLWTREGPAMKAIFPRAQWRIDRTLR